MQRRPHFMPLTLSALLLCVLTTAAHAVQPDAWITTKVKIALLTSSGVDGYPIHVDTDNGRVTLYGEVATRGQRTEADRVAMRVRGVRNVRDLIQVVPRAQRKWANSRDDQLKTGVNRALRADPALEGSDIHARSVNQGVVLLAGKAATAPMHLQALQDAADVSGVRRVESEIESPDQAGDHDAWYDEPTARDSRPNGLTDSWITTKTKLQFFSDRGINSSDISVDTHGGVITLFGVAPTPDVRERAEQVANRVHGSRGVRNEIRVVPGAHLGSAMAADRDISSSIRQRLGDADLHGAQIHVEVKAGMVRLSGTVARPMDRYTAMAIARQANGVRSVEDDLRVNGQRAGRQ